MSEKTETMKYTSLRLDDDKYLPQFKYPTMLFIRSSSRECWDIENLKLTLILPLSSWVIIWKHPSASVKPISHSLVILLTKTVGTIAGLTLGNSSFNF